MSLSLAIGNFLYQNVFILYKPVYSVFKKRQDAFEIDLLKKYIRPGDRVLDIGANIGFYATMLSSLVGKTGEVHCFEPDKKNFGYLRKAVGRLKNVTVNNKAVGPRIETLKMYTSKKINVDHRTYQPEVYDQVIEIEATSIDEYLASKNYQVDVIKIDIQGFEFEAMKGMEQTLDRNQHVKIISEFWPYGLRKAGSSLTEYFSLLHSKGFVCYLLEKRSLSVLDSRKVEKLEPLDEKHYFNILAVRENV